MSTIAARSSKSGQAYPRMDSCILEETIIITRSQRRVSACCAKPWRAKVLHIPLQGSRPHVGHKSPGCGHQNQPTMSTSSEDKHRVHHPPTGMPLNEQSQGRGIKMRLSSGIHGSGESRLSLQIKTYLEGRSIKAMFQLAVNQGRRTGRGQGLFEPLQVLFIAVPD